METTAKTLAATDVRHRWRMGPEALWLVGISAVLTSVGLAVLFSASAIVALNATGSSTYYLARQTTGVAAGALGFAVVAKFDAEKLEEWAWPIMWFTIVTMALTLVVRDSS